MGVGLTVPSNVGVGVFGIVDVGVYVDVGAASNVGLWVFVRVGAASKVGLWVFVCVGIWVFVFVGLGVDVRVCVLELVVVCVIAVVGVLLPEPVLLGVFESVGVASTIRLVGVPRLLFRDPSEACECGTNRSKERNKMKITIEPTHNFINFTLLRLNI